MDPHDLAHFLIGAVTKRELGFGARSSLFASLGAADFILPPLPSHVFTRDTSAWIFNGAGTVR